MRFSGVTPQGSQLLCFFPLADRVCRAGESLSLHVFVVSQLSGGVGYEAFSCCLLYDIAVVSAFRRKVCSYSSSIDIISRDVSPELLTAAVDVGLPTGT